MSLSQELWRLNVARAGPHLPCPSLSLSLSFPVCLCLCLTLFSLSLSLSVSPSISLALPGSLLSPTLHYRGVKVAADPEGAAADPDCAGALVLGSSLWNHPGQAQAPLSKPLSVCGVSSWPPKVRYGFILGAVGKFMVTSHYPSIASGVRPQPLNLAELLTLAPWPSASAHMVVSQQCPRNASSRQSSALLFRIITTLPRDSVFSPSSKRGRKEGSGPFGVPGCDLGAHVCVTLEVPALPRWGPCAHASLFQRM